MTNRKTHLLSIVFYFRSICRSKRVDSIFGDMWWFLCCSCSCLGLTPTNRSSNSYFRLTQPTIFWRSEENTVPLFLWLCQWFFVLFIWWRRLLEMGGGGRKGIQRKRNHAHDLQAKWQSEWNYFPSEMETLCVPVYMVEGWWKRSVDVSHKTWALSWLELRWV